MTERPILFTGEMVRQLPGICDGETCKSQTRRLNGLDEINETRDLWFLDGINVHNGNAFAVFSQPLACNPAQRWVKPVKCPYGAPGDRLWVRETWADANSDDGPVICYRADLDRHYCHKDAWPIEYERYPGCSFSNWAGDLESGTEGHWRPSIFMPRWASRITLEITDVRVQRVQEIGQGDACEEGRPLGVEPIEWYAALWNKINGKKAPWASNPWVWVIGFKRIDAEKAEAAG